MAVIHLTKDTFEAEVLRSEKPVLVDFWATWCGPCKMIAPVLEEIERENADLVKVAKVNVDDEPELAAAFRIESIPTLVLIKDGKLADSMIGFRPKKDIERLIGKGV